MKKYLKYIAIILVLAVGYKLADKALDKLYLSKYDIIDYTGDTRYSTINKVMDKRFKKSETAILVNTNYLNQAIAVSPYAYSNNIPVLYTEKNKMPEPVYEELERLGVKKVIMIGGVNYISNVVTRSLDRLGYETDRIVDSGGINLSIKMAEMMDSQKNIDSIAVVTDDELDIPNGISFLPVAQTENIPIMVTTNNENDIIKLQKFVKKHNIKKTYLVGINNYYNTNIEKTLPGVVRIAGKDRYDINRKIMDKFFSDKSNKKVYVSKGGEVIHKRHIAPGQLINALAVSPLAADNKAPLMYIDENYFSSDESKLIKQKGYKEINQVGFNIERRNFFNVERFKVFTTIVLILISLLMVIRLISFKAK